MKRLVLISVFILALLAPLACLGATYRVTATWEPPETNSDGSPIDDLSGFALYYGASPGVYGTQINVPNVSSYTFTMQADPGSTWYFNISAFDFAGHDSGYAGEVVNEFPFPQDLAPSLPTNLYIESVYEGP